MRAHGQDKRQTTFVLFFSTLKNINPIYSADLDDDAMMLFTQILCTHPSIYTLYLHIFSLCSNNNDALTYINKVAVWIFTNFIFLAVCYFVTLSQWWWWGWRFYPNSAQYADAIPLLLFVSRIFFLIPNWISFMYVVCTSNTDHWKK